MRVLAFLLPAVVCGIAGSACSGILGIEEPTLRDGGPRTLVSISIGSDSLRLPLGASRQLTAIGMFNNGSSEDLTAGAEFSVEAGSSLMISPTGLARALALGPSTVMAKLGGVEGRATVEVGPPAPDRLVFGLGNFQLAQEQRARVHVRAVLTDGSMQDVTAAAAYSTDSPGVATVTAGQIDGVAAGMATITASLGAAQPATVQVTVTSKPCQPVINELQTGGAASPADEWVEILNPCTKGFDVTSWTLVYRSPTNVGAADSTLLVTLAGQLAAGAILLFGGEGYAGTKDGQWTGATGVLAQSSGAIALRSGAASTGPIVDSVAYGAVSTGHPFLEVMAMPALANDRSAQRLPFDGRDDGNNAVDFVQVTGRTPRALNAP